MSFFVYFVVLLVAAASTLFGLDLLTSPLPEKPPVAATQTANRTGQQSAKAEQKGARADATGGGDRTVTPVYPAAPGGNKDVRLVYPPTNETTRSAAEKPPKQTAQGSVTQQSMVETKSTDETAQPAKNHDGQLSRNEQTTSAVQPDAQLRGGRCNIAACSAAYSSFRASDCTYQPYGGPRRACEKTGATVPRTARDFNHAGRDVRHSRREADLDGIADRVPHFNADPNLGFDNPFSRRSVIVIERGYGGWR